MTEAEWLACSDPGPMLGFLNGKASDRKLRLIAVACCRSILQFMPDQRCLEALAVCERFADGMADEQELRSAAVAALESAEDNSLAVEGQSFAIGQGIYFAARTVFHAANPLALEAAATTTRCLFYAVVGAGGDDLTARSAAGENARQFRISTLIDVFGNPFRPVTLNPAWRTPKVTTLAQTIYNDRAFDRMPELADALQEAGCDHQDLLSHCRGPGPHVKGCWVVDLLLGKE